MSRIFLSHSSINEIEAVALKNWLADNGWGDEDVFLDIDPERGLAAGERWQEALRKAADRCEAVVFIISPAWAKSKWCLAEFLLAKSLHKLIFGVVLKEVAIGELPTEMTSEWQLCSLVGEGPTETIQFSHWQQEQRVAFLTEGLKRLKLGLQKAGLSADFFPWPPKHDPDRAPYRGLQALDVDDAAVFFGRDVEILRGLDALRGMRDSVDKKLFVILGASGAGKSSFLRAGLIPRLKRDDRHFLVLPVIRPQREPLSGGYGLANTLHKARDEFKLPPQNRGEILAQLKQGPTKLAEHLRALQDAAQNRLITPANEGAPTPTLLLTVDQAEELFNADAGQEAKDFLQLIGQMLRQDSVNRALPCIIAFTIRSDHYEPLQTATELATLQSVVFDDLKPMPPDRFREVILGPAKRASVQGSKLDIKPDLINQLLDDCSEGGDTLPLLSLTLATLHQDYGSDGDLRIDEYQSMGGITGIVKKEAEAILSTDPATREQQLKWLHAAFIPWLVTINPQNDQPMRRVAKLNELPAESRPLIEALAAKRLLVMDKRAYETVVEIAHEALLRQWDELDEWLRTESNDLRDADALEFQAKEWRKNNLKDAWLWEGERLANAEALYAKLTFRKRLDACYDFLVTSRHQEDNRNAEKEQLRQSEIEALKKLAEEHAVRADVEEKAKIAALDSTERLRQRAVLISIAATVIMLGFLSLFWLYYTGNSVRSVLVKVGLWTHLFHPIEPNDMVLIPKDNFFMGNKDLCNKCDDEKPYHLVGINKPFYISTKEVTVAEFDIYALARGRPLSNMLRQGDKQTFGIDENKHPVTYVSWYEAVDYAKWLSDETGKHYRLPTEAEWEYAARGKTKNDRYWGENNACDYANICDDECSKEYPQDKYSEEKKFFDCNDSSPSTSEVGKYKPNAFGLFDMIGNVWEWTADCYNKSYEELPNDGSAWKGQGTCPRARVARGGSWFSNPDYARVNKRLWFNPEVRNFHLGFRLVCDMNANYVCGKPS